MKKFLAANVWVRSSSLGSAGLREPILADFA